MKQTAMSAAMQRAGVNVAELHLRQHAIDVLRKHHRNVERAVPTFSNIVNGDPVLMRELLREYLLRVDTEILAGDLVQSAIHGRPVAGQNIHGDEHDHRTRDSQQTTVISSPVALCHELSTRQKHAAATVAKSIALTILDTFKIDGIAIGDWQVGDALRRGRQKTYEGRVLLLMARVTANADPFAKLRDIVRVIEAQRIIQKATEEADAA